MRLPLVCTMLAVMLSTTLAIADPPKDRVLLSSVQTLTLYANRRTTGRRLLPVSQMACSSNKRHCQLAAASMMRCRKDGHSYDPDSIQWLCDAIIADGFELGFVSIGCEGYDTADDAWVLRGSCGAKYEVMPTKEGRDRYGDGEGISGFSLWVITLVVLAFVALFCVVSCVSEPKEKQTTNGYPANGQAVQRRVDDPSRESDNDQSQDESRPLQGTHVSRSYGVTENR